MNQHTHTQPKSGLSPALNDREFNRFSTLIYETVGIKMPPAKKIMLEVRLQKRLKALGFGTFEEYGDYVFSVEGRKNELVQLIDVVTTNKTDFFREPAHFEYLVKGGYLLLGHRRCAVSMGDKLMKQIR